MLFGSGTFGFVILLRARCRPSICSGAAFQLNLGLVKWNCYKAVIGILTQSLPLPSNTFKTCADRR